MNVVKGGHPCRSARRGLTGVPHSLTGIPAGFTLGRQTKQASRRTVEANQ